MTHKPVPDAKRATRARGDRRAPPTRRPPARHLALGAEGEARAARHLEAAGYRIADRNVRAGGVELDIVAERRGLVVFVEVKTRRGTHQGGAELAVGWSKQQRLVRGAVAWLRKRRRPARAMRFDVMAWHVERTGPGDDDLAWHLTHYEGAFDGSG